MTHLRLVVLASVILLALPVLAIYIFPQQDSRTASQTQPVSPKIVYRLPPAKPNDLDGVGIKLRGDTLNLRVNTSYDQPGYALHSFIAALKTYPRIPHIRASWSMLVFMNSMDTTVLYDRRKPDLVLFSKGSGDLGAYQDHLLFTGVQEAMFVKLADAHRNDYNKLPESVFRDLSKYGCRKHDLGSWQKSPP